MRVSTQITESTLTLGGGKEHEDLLLVWIAGVLGEQSEEGLRGRITLDVGAPIQKLPSSCDQLSGLVIAPNGRPSALVGAESDLFVPDGLGDAK